MDGKSFLFGGAIGAVLGIIGGYYLALHVLEEQAEEDIEAHREFLNRQYDKKVTKLKEELEETKAANEVQAERLIKVYSGSQVATTGRIVQADMEPTEPYYDEEDEEEYSSEINEETYLEESADRDEETIVEQKGPYLIDEDTYYGIDDHDQEKIEIYYYREDKVFAEGNDTKMSRSEAIEYFGESALSLLEHTTRTVYVRHLDMGCDWVIYGLDESYGKAVAAKVETPKEADKRRASRRQSVNK